MTKIETQEFIESRLNYFIFSSNKKPDLVFGMTHWLTRYPSGLTNTDHIIAARIYPLKQIKQTIGALRSTLQRPGCVLLPDDICEYIYKSYIKDTQPFMSVLYNQNDTIVYCLDGKYRMIRYNQTVGDLYTTLTTTEWKFFLVYKIIPDTEEPSVVTVLDNRVSGVEVSAVNNEGSFVVTYNNTNIKITIRCPSLNRDINIQFGGHIFSVNALFMIKFDNLKLYQLSPKNKINIEIKLTDLSFATIQFKAFKLIAYRSELVEGGISYTPHDDLTTCTVNINLLKATMAPILKQLLQQ